MNASGPQRIPGTGITGCPNCGAGLTGRRGVQWHLRSIWCLGCGWACNRNSSGRPVTPDGHPLRI